MDFTLNEEQQILREELRKFLEAEIRPLDDRWGDEEMTAERARELCKKLIPWGYMGGGAEALGVATRRSRASRPRSSPGCSRRSPASPA